ncbi:MAG TPA: diguanylate cyclase response regulator [Spirochaetaceae bacterium]|nr:diguanylate cyclase response regulator [Spirochaetaceae bacterium]HAW85017.1 diguanylate cyclase response regulator [Spirochaetaceae bacterium]HAX38059.1 diguanylate cyclase response regulator [Spirochaetaceae bacterium]HBO40660.1 diguanylate cyclase response regulator [Spirochaetaceae bacterium]HCQ87716.1 diguanylate cyclase response regulator [Spirochaetaceae bacterium]
MAGMIDSRPGKPLQTLLLVDDSPDNLAILAGHLNNDYVISQAASGAEALRLIQTELSPDLILLDVLMPGMDGYEVFRRLAALPCARDIPVIFITALDEAQNEVAAIEMGAVDFVSKPINHVILKARIRNHLQYKALRDELRNQSMMDSLTALANRRRFMEALSAEWFRAVRYSTWLAILFIDIDDFKQYNDRYGHIAGDDCLKAVASAIRQVPKRSHDLVARWGGEEFVCILPDASEAAAAQLAERMRLAVQSLALEHAAGSTGRVVTISVGLAGIKPDREHKFETLIELADQALYRAKKTGKNRVCVYGDPSNAGNAGIVGDASLSDRPLLASQAT